MPQQPKILVVGDAMVDLYHFGTTTRISPEAPIPIVKVTGQEQFHGGAGNVADNLRTLGAEVVLCQGLAPHPDDPQYGVIPIKHRLMVGTTQMARWDEYDEVRSIPIKALEAVVNGWTPDAIVVSDYGKGSIDQTIRTWINKAGLPTFVDTKGSPSYYLDDFTFFPNLHEWGIHEKSYNELGNVILKRSADGIMRLQYNTMLEWYPAYATNVVSVCGAGDTVIAAYAYFTTLGDPAALFKASIAAAIVVEKPWTATASVAEIEERIKCLDTKRALKNEPKLVSSGG
jgi:D-beta-D-heptose 7-phosphate kinase/D-beta-D-heptose 1-phosphate adenosyltransferase